MLDEKRTAQKATRHVSKLDGMRNERRDAETSAFQRHLAITLTKNFSSSGSFTRSVASFSLFSN